MIVDEIHYLLPEWPLSEGSKIDHIENDDGANWCPADTYDPIEVAWSPAVTFSWILFDDDDAPA